MISALSDAGVLVGGFMLRLLIVSAAVPITIIQADTRNRIGRSALFHRGNPWHTPSRQPV